MSYLKMSSRFFCMMAMPFALMFAACTTDGDQPISGGASEERGFYAGLENITLTAAAYRVTASPQEGESQDSAFAIEAYRRHSIAWLYELDSTTFAKTGASYSDTLWNDGDMFSFKNVALKSPYVQLRVSGWDADGTRGDLVAIADVRKTKNVNLNLLTTLKAALWRYLAAEGVSHDSLDVRSEIATLEAIGVVERFNGFESDEILENSGYIMTEAALSEMFVGSTGVEWFSVDSTVSTLERGGNLDELDSKTRNRLMERLSWGLSRKTWISRMNHDVLESSELDEKVMSIFEEELAFSKILADVYMELMGEGLCTESREGEFVKLADTSIYLACRSEGWRLEMGETGKVHAENGTMTDARDGKTYRTVTYSIDGKQQTWMAENLKYEYGKSRCLDDKDSRCEVFGRLYTWYESLALDSSIVWTKEGCMEYYRPEYERYEACVAEYRDQPDVDSVTLEYRCGSPVDLALWCEDSYDMHAPKYKYMMAFELMDSVNHQGVCPDSWHVATKDDWEGLYEYIEDAYKVEKKDVVWYLLASEYTEGPVGFGLQLLPTWEGMRTSRQKEMEASGKLRLFNEHVPVYAIPVFEFDWTKPVEAYLEEYEYILSLASGYETRWYVDDEWGNGFNGWVRYGSLAVQSDPNDIWRVKNMPVRCVKN